jgi:site-specific DNA-cytosine methylase
MIMGVKKKYCSKTKLVPTEFNPNDSTQSYASQLRNNGGFFSVWDEESVEAPDLVDVLSDLDFEGWSPESKEYRKDAQSDFQRFIRGQKSLTGVQKAAWELMQQHTISRSNQFTGTQIAGRLLPLPKFSMGHSELTDHEFSRHSMHVVERFQFMLDNNITKKEDLPLEMRTKKFNQKPLPPRWSEKPSITVTSLPDDYVHYSRPRTFSVREWARIQTFPDSHIFCGKRTTGGSRRAGSPDNWDREVPKYTQIGNAVPPLLGKAIGERIRDIISP